MGKFVEVSCFLLGKYIFVALDIFKKTHHNKDIRNELEAWLTFLCSEDPETIAALMTNLRLQTALEEIEQLKKGKS